MRKDFTKRDEADEDQGHARSDRGIYVPAFVLAFLRNIFREHGNEKHADRATGNEVTKEIGEGERRVVGVRDGAGTKLMGHRPLAQETKNPAEQHYNEQDAGGLEQVVIASRRFRHVRHLNEEVELFEASGFLAEEWVYSNFLM